MRIKKFASQPLLMTTIQKLASEIGKKCNEKRYSLVTAESCTGGGLAFSLTKNSDSSSILERGYIVYSVTSKEEVLQISSYTLQTYGVVSKEVAEEMAAKALENSKAQISIAITGVDEESAKEDGVNKPGIVWISCAGIDKKILTKKVEIRGNREKFCEESIFEGFKMLMEFIS